jgi:hypothetical protein
MAEVLTIGFGAALVCAGVTTAIFVARALHSQHQNLWGSGRADETWLSKVHVGTVLVGWCAIVLFGVQGMLFWLPRSWDEGLFIVAGMAAMGSIPLLMQIERLPRMRRKIEVESAVTTWMREQLKYPNTPSPSQLERLANDAADATKTAAEQEIAATKHVFAKSLKERDERLEAQAVQRLQREQAAQVEQAERRRREDEEQAANQHLDKALKALVKHLPTTSDSMAMEKGEEAVVDHAVLIASWTLFKELIVSTQPSSQAEVTAAEHRLGANLAKLPGVELPAGAQVSILFSGSERDGYCDVVAVVPGDRKPLGEIIRYDDSLRGLLAAFFFAAALQRNWSWGHGCYDRDYGLLVTEDEVKAVVRDFRLPKRGEATWPPAGIRVRRLPDAYVLSCLSTRPGMGLFDLSVEVNRGSASPLLVRDIYEWGRGVLY